MVGQHPLPSGYLVKNVARQPGTHLVPEQNRASTNYHYERGVEAKEAGR